MNYKVGDRVRIKSIDWYNENKNNDNYIDLIRANDLGFNFIETMTAFCGKVMTISDISCDYYNMLEDSGDYYWTDDMIEGLVEEENNRLIETVVDIVRESNDRYRIVIDPRFDIEVDEGEYYVVRRKKEYPKTYEECCNVLDWNHRDYDRVGYESELLCKFQVLLLCRDAYWKIAGEEMRLGKPWEPDWLNLNVRKHCIYYVGNEIRKQPMLEVHHCLAFPTEEMRDAFDNFKELINDCKELL